MRTKSLPFQLEQTSKGTFALQGFAGGMLTAFIFTVAMMIANPHPTNLLIVFYVYPILAIAGVFGLIKSLPLGAMYHILGVRMRAPSSVHGLPLWQQDSLSNQRISCPQASGPI